MGSVAKDIPKKPSTKKSKTRGGNVMKGGAATQEKVIAVYTVIANDNGFNGPLIDFITQNDVTIRQFIWFVAENYNFQSKDCIEFLQLHTDHPKYSDIKKAFVYWHQAYIQFKKDYLDDLGRVAQITRDTYHMPIDPTTLTTYNTDMDALSGKYATHCIHDGYTKRDLKSNLAIFEAFYTKYNTSAVLDKNSYLQKLNLFVEKNNKMDMTMMTKIYDMHAKHNDNEVQNGIKILIKSFLDDMLIQCQTISLSNHRLVKIGSAEPEPSTSISEKDASVLIAEFKKKHAPIIGPIDLSCDDHVTGNRIIPLRYIDLKLPEIEVFNDIINKRQQGKCSQGSQGSQGIQGSPTVGNIITDIDIVDGMMLGYYEAPHESIFNNYIYDIDEHLRLIKDRYTDDIEKFKPQGSARNVNKKSIFSINYPMGIAQKHVRVKVDGSNNVTLTTFYYNAATMTTICWEDSQIANRDQSLFGIHQALPKLIRSQFVEKTSKPLHHRAYVIFGYISDPDERYKYYNDAIYQFYAHAPTELCLRGRLMCTVDDVEALIGMYGGSETKNVEYRKCIKQGVFVQTTKTRGGAKTYVGGANKRAQNPRK